MGDTPAILALDQGTTNTKALLVGIDGAVLGAGSVPTGVVHPRPGWAEQSAQGIADSVAAAIAQAIAQANATAPGPVDIRAIGISNQRESVIAWDGADGTAIGPCVLWQCRRSAPLCATLREAGHAGQIEALSGLGLDPLFSAGKLRWLLDNSEGAGALLEAGRLRVGTVDSWLIWHLTGGETHATDASNAARTQLLDIEACAWSPRLLALFGIPAGILPQVRASDALFGHTSGGFAGLPAGIPIHAVMGDSHAALFGHAITRPGWVKVTMGTGSSLMCPTAGRAVSRHGLSSTIAWARESGGPVHALEGNITVSGQTAAFTAELLGLGGPQALSDLAASVPDSDGVYLVPALAGLGAPHWQEQARGIICGMSLGTRPAHVARAALEGIAHQIADVIAAIEADLGAPLEAICVDGNAARNDLLLQMLADLSGRPVERRTQTELSALGVAIMAADAVGCPLPETLVARDRRFAPAMDEAERSAARAGWRLAIERAVLQ